MKKLLFGFILTLASALAFALPSPRQIEDALAAQKYADAKSMVQEVLREKPKSARAHLLNAFLLIHVDHNKTAANAELQTAAGLDLDGDVKRSPLFGRVVAEIDMQPVAKPVKTVTYSGPDFNEVAILMLKIALLIAVVVALAYFVSWLIDLMCARRPTEIRFYGNAGSGVASSSPDPVSPAPAGTHYAHTVAPVVVAQQQPAMGAFGPAASVAGGVVAGNLMADSLLHRHSHHHRDADDDYEEEQRRRRRREEDSYSAPSYTPSPVSYESERSSFSSGSSDSSWGSSDSSSSDSSSSASDW
jgi:hypothetical protein